MIWQNNRDSLCMIMHVWLRPSTEEQPSTSKESRKDPFVDLWDGSSSENQRQLSSSNTVEYSGTEEFAHHKAMQVLAAYNSPPRLLAGKCRTLSCSVARHVFCITASSVQSERDFSCVENTITDTRSRLSERKVESIELIRWGMCAGLVCGH